MSNIVEKLNEHINFTDGFFVEAGSYDGIFSSNTLTLEKDLNWKGLLIEPNFEKYLECLKNRKGSITVSAALCSFKEYKKNKVLYSTYDGPSSSINNLRHKKRKFIIKKKNKINLIPQYALPFSLLMDNLGLDNQDVDFFSLDVEGYEFKVLKGIDFAKHKPKYFLVEVYSYDEDRIFKLLKKKNYKEPINLTNYNKIDNPTWDGLHQDYLFVSK